MAAGKLSPLQVRILHCLAGCTPRWTLSGGGALVGVHTKHRTTRDLDLFWQQSRSLGTVPETVQRQLEATGMIVSVQQRAKAFCRLEVRDDGELMLVDLIADPVPLAEPPVEVEVDGVPIQIDTAHQILVNKLCALLSRSELRDLQDVNALLVAGGDLRRALADAPEQDGGFSPLTFAYTARQLPIVKLARALGWGAENASALVRFRDKLVDDVLALAVPEPGDRQP